MADFSLKPDETVLLESNRREAKVLTLLGAGGQGEVYEVEFAAQRLAMKWYFSAGATRAQLASLRRLVEKGSPGPDFLWPIDLVAKKGSNRFGYLMRLREKRFKSLVALMKGQVDPGFYELIQVGLRLCLNFLKLHSQGFCYRDISFGNLFFDPGSGEILICDNDNVGVDGGAACGVLGTPRFMAPEVVRGEAVPSIQTDLYSLAVLLFNLFFLHHPLEGRREAAIHCMDLPALNRIYGIQPLFIFDPENRENEPVPGVHDTVLSYWNLYPPEFKIAFCRAFTAGLRDPASGRVRESEWARLLFQLLDALVLCPQCGVENFYHVETLPPCWSCKNASNEKHLRLCFEGRQIFLAPGKEIFSLASGGTDLALLSHPLARVLSHPEKKDLPGIKNLSTDDLLCVRPDGGKVLLAPGKSILAIPGLTLGWPGGARIS